MKNKNKSSKKNGRRSMKGKWGKVGAPPKTTRYPSGTFTMATLFKRNSNQCELSIRNKVDSMLVAGELIQLKARKQAHGGVGRPKAVFILKENFDASQHEKTDKPLKARVRRPRQASTPAPTDVVAPAAQPVSENVEIPTTAVVETTPAPAPETNVIPTPTPEQPVNETSETVSETAEAPVAQAA